MNTFQSTIEEQKEWKALVQKIKELESKLREYPQYSDINTIADNAKEFKSTTDQIKHYRSRYSAYEQEFLLLGSKYSI